MKKLLLLLLIFPLVSCDISSLFAPSLNMDDFPFKIEPFDKKSELMESSKNDPLCGTFKYYSGESENGIVDIAIELTPNPIDFINDLLFL